MAAHRFAVIRSGTIICGSGRSESLATEPLLAASRAIARITQRGWKVAVTGAGSAAHVFLNAARTLNASERRLAQIGTHIVEANTLVALSALQSTSCDVAPYVARSIDAVETALIEHAACVVGPLPGCISTDSIAALVAEALRASYVVFLKKGLLFTEDPDESVTEITSTELVQIAMAHDQRAGATAPIDVLAAIVLRRSGIPAAFLLHDDADALDEVLLGNSSVRRTLILPASLGRG
jgi:uridylate kinase